MNDGKLRSSIRKDARELLKVGTSRQDTYLQLKEKFNYPKQVADVMKTMPSQAALKKYGIYNHILLGIILLMPVLLIIRSGNHAANVAFLFYAYIVASRTLEFYIILTTLSGLALIATIGIMIFQPFAPGEWVDALLLLILLIPMAIMPVWIRKRFCPPPEIKYEDYTDANGISRRKTIYTFTDIQQT